VRIEEEIPSPDPFPRRGKKRGEMTGAFQRKAIPEPLSKVVEK